MWIILLVTIFLSFSSPIYSAIEPIQPPILDPWIPIPPAIECSSRANVTLQKISCNCTRVPADIQIYPTYKYTPGYWKDCGCSYGAAIPFSAPCEKRIFGSDTRCLSSTGSYPAGWDNSCSAVSGSVYTAERDGCKIGDAQTTCYASSSCSPSKGSNGVCGLADGKSYQIYPTSNLCSSPGTVTPMDSVGTDGEFNWTCNGTAGSCGGANGTTANCLAYKDNLPLLSSLELKTYDGDTVIAETGDRNQICQPIFKQDTVNPNGVQFVVTATDVQGTIDIGEIQVRLKNTTNTYTFTAVASVNGVATIPVDLSASGVANGIYNIEVLINDVTSGITADWYDTNRDFKYWNCEVPVSGAFYDGSLGETCPNYSTTLAYYAGLTSLLFTSAKSGLSSNMTINGDPTYTSDSNPLIWGTSGYQAIFNNGLAATNKSLKLIDLGIGTTKVNCNSTLSFDLDSTIVDPYADTPKLQADFSGMINQESWFQTINGGVFGKSTISNYVPLTCKLSTNCIEATAIRGLVAAPTINSFNNIKYSSPSNWYTNQSLVTKINYFEKYRKISGVGTTLIEGDLNDSNVINNTDGLLMVNGNVTISQNKENVDDEYFFMIVASGDITVDPSVNKFDGMLVGNNINIGGTSIDQLTINGSLYGTNLVNITRSFTDKMDNNGYPAVVVSYRPDFIFNMPSSMAKNVTEWRWGN